MVAFNVFAQLLIFFHFKMPEPPNNYIISNMRNLRPIQNGKKVVNC